MYFHQQLKGTGRSRTLVREGYRHADDYGSGFMSLIDGDLSFYDLSNPEFEDAADS